MCWSGLFVDEVCACKAYPCAAAGAGAALRALFFPAAYHVVLIIYSLKL